MRCRYGHLAAVLIAVAGLGMLSGCIGMPPIAEQERKIRNNELTLRKLEPRAFVRAWGMPTYQHMEFMPFFGMKDGSMVPRSRLAVGARLLGGKRPLMRETPCSSRIPTVAGSWYFWTRSSSIGKNFQPTSCTK